MVPSEVVGGSEERISKLIIRTAVRVKTLWMTCDVVQFLDLLAASTGVYRECILRMGDAYGFNTTSEMDVLTRWCRLLVRHNCQDSVPVICRCLETFGNTEEAEGVWAALVEKSRAETKWKFITQDLWKN